MCAQVHNPFLGPCLFPAILFFWSPLKHHLFLKPSRPPPLLFPFYSTQIGDSPPFPFFRCVTLSSTDPFFYRFLTATLGHPHSRPAFYVMPCLKGFPNRRRPRPIDSSRTLSHTHPSTLHAPLLTQPRPNNYIRPPLTPAPPPVAT